MGPTGAPTAVAGARPPVDVKRAAGAAAGGAVALLGICVLLWIRGRSQRRHRPASSHEEAEIIGAPRDGQSKSPDGGDTARPEEVLIRSAAMNERHGTARRKMQHLSSSSGVTPFTAQPEPSLVAAAEKDIKTLWQDAGRGESTQSVPHAPLTEEKRENPIREHLRRTAAIPQPPSRVADETATIRAELDRVRTENERARIALERQIEILRQAVEPPPYSDGGRSENGGDGS